MAELDVLPQDKRDETARILSIISKGILIPGAVLAPNILSLLGQQLDPQQKNSAKTLRAVRYAKSQGWLTLRDSPQSHGVEVALSNSGKLKWDKLELEQPLTMKKWDKKWRVVLFDIPLKHKKQGEVFRNHLKRLGFRQLQKSVWITPYPCATIIVALRQLYDIRYSVRLLEATAIDDELSLKLQFHL